MNIANSLKPNKISISKDKMAYLLAIIVLFVSIWINDGANVACLLLFCAFGLTAFYGILKEK